MQNLQAKIKDWPHVTEILKAESFIDYSSINEDILSANQRFGTAVHKATELSDLEILDITTLSKSLIPYLNAWEKAKKELGLKVLKQYVEKLVWSNRWKFRGTLDRIMERRGKLALIEIKATASILPANCLQTAFYQIAFEEMTRKKIKERWVIRLKPDGYEAKLCKEMSDKDVCIGMVQSYYWKRMHLKRG